MSHNTVETVWSAYMEAYGPQTAGERERLLKICVADDVKFTNPGGEGATRQRLMNHIEEFQTKMPGARFLTDKLYSHHGELLAVWSLLKGDGAKIATGYNFVQFDDEGRINTLAGFF